MRYTCTLPVFVTIIYYSNDLRRPCSLDNYTFLGKLLPLEFDPKANCMNITNFMMQYITSDDLAM